MRSHADETQLPQTMSFCVCLAWSPLPQLRNSFLPFSDVVLGGKDARDEAYISSLLPMGRVPLGPSSFGLAPFFLSAHDFFSADQPQVNVFLS